MKNQNRAVPSRREGLSTLPQRTLASHHSPDTSAGMSAWGCFRTNGNGGEKYVLHGNIRHDFCRP